MSNLYPAIFRFILFSRLHLNFFVHTFWHMHPFTHIPRTRKFQSAVKPPNFSHLFTRYKWQLYTFTHATQYYLCKYLRWYIGKKIFAFKAFFVTLDIFQELQGSWVFSRTFLRDICTIKFFHRGHMLAILIPRFTFVCGHFHIWRVHSCRICHNLWGKSCPHHASSFV